MQGSKSWLNSMPAISRGGRRLLVGAAVAALLCVYAAEVTVSSRALSATWDEPCHLLAGYRYWQAGDYGVNPEHPPLPKLIGAFPLLFMHLKGTVVGVDDSKPTVVIDGRKLVYRNNADALLLRARLAEAAVGLLLILLLFEAGYQLLGAGAAWIAVVLAVFEPNLLAHTTLVTTDFALACFELAAVYALWRVAEKPATVRVVGCGVMCGLALASKHSGLVVLPTLALLSAAEIACRVAALQPNDPARAALRRQQTRTWAARLCAIYGVALLVLWGFYGFRYEARPYGWPLWESVASYTHVLHGHLDAALITQAAQFHLLPEAYLFGLTDVMMVTQGPRISFLFGRLYPHALWYYFPVDFVIKSTLGFLLLLALAFAAFRSWSGERYRKAAYILIPPAFFMAVALTSGTNLGIRHVLPVYPFLILAAAAGAWELGRRTPAWAVAVAALLALHVASSARTAPDYLAYSNELFGGTSQTYRWLSDSNVDWGQGMREAARYVARHNIKDCWLAYFGTADPAYYGLPCKLLPDPFLRWWGDPISVPPEKYHGVVLVSGTEIAAPYWGPEVLNPYSEFLGKKPAANIGGSILVFEGDIDLHAASALGHLYKAWEYVYERRQESAIREALRAGELLPGHPGPPFTIGYVLAQENRTEAARGQFQESLRLAQAASPEFQPRWVRAAEAELARLAEGSKQ